MKDYFFGRYVVSKPFIYDNASSVSWKVGSLVYLKAVAREDACDTNHNPDMFNKYAASLLTLGLSRVSAFAPVAVSPFPSVLAASQRANNIVNMSTEGSIDVSSYMGGSAPEGTEDYISKCLLSPECHLGAQRVPTLLPLSHLSSSSSALESSATNNDPCERSEGG